MANSNNSKYRVSLKFSDKDPDQEEVVALLKQMGRRKSAFITKAIKFYLNENPNADIPGVTSTTISKSSVRAILKELLSEMDLTSIETKSIKKEVKEEIVIPKEQEKEEEISNDEVDSFLDGLSAWDMSDY